MELHLFTLSSNLLAPLPLLIDSNALQGYEISWQALYIVGTLIVAALISYESVTLKRHEGKLPATKLLQVASILEMVWLAVSVAVLYYGNFLPLLKAIPMAYILYSVFGWIYGFYLLKQSDIDVENVDDIQMPAKYMDYTLSFATVMLLTCLGILAYLYLKGYILLGLS